MMAVGKVFHLWVETRKILGSMGIIVSPAALLHASEHK